MSRDAEGPRGAGNYNNSLGVVDHVSDEDFDPGFLALGDRLALPEGWIYRARTLEDELVMRATHDSDPLNRVVLDEFENNYQRLRTV